MRLALGWNERYVGAEKMATGMWWTFCALGRAAALTAVTAHTDGTKITLLKNKTVQIVTGSLYFESECVSKDHIWADCYKGKAWVWAVSSLAACLICSDWQQLNKWVKWQEMKSSSLLDKCQVECWSGKEKKPHTEYVTLKQHGQSSASVVPLVSVVQFVENICC